LLPESFRLREEAVLRADLAQLSDSLKALDKQMAQKLATQKRLNMSIAFQHSLIEPTCRASCARSSSSCKP
jgi:hemolysin D